MLLVHQFYSLNALQRILTIDVLIKCAVPLALCYRSKYIKLKENSYQRLPLKTLSKTFICFFKENNNEIYSERLYFYCIGKQLLYVVIEDHCFQSEILLLYTKKINLIVIKIRRAAVFQCCPRLVENFKKQNGFLFNYCEIKHRRPIIIVRKSQPTST